MSFLASPFSGILILIACVFAVAFFSNLKEPEPFLGLCTRKSCLKVWVGVLGNSSADKVSDVIEGHTMQTCEVAPQPGPPGKSVFHNVCPLEGETQSSRYPAIISNEQPHLWGSNCDHFACLVS